MPISSAASLMVCFLLVVQAGGADDHLLAVLAANVEMNHRRSRTGEIDNHVELVDHLGQAVGDGDTQFADPGQLSGVGTHQRGVRSLRGSAQFETLGLGHGLNQGLAHTPGGTHYCNSDHLVVFPVLMMARGRSRAIDSDPERLAVQPTDSETHTLEEFFTPSTQDVRVWDCVCSRRP